MFGKQRASAGNIQTEDTTSIQNTDVGQTRWKGDQDNYVMLIQK